MKKSLCLILSVLLLAMLLCGCGGSSSPKAEYARTDSAKPASSGSGAMYDNGAGWAAEIAVEPAMKEESNAVTQTAAGLPENVKLIYRANIDMESTEFDTALQGLNELVARLGGYYENSELNNYASYRHGYYTVRLPAEHFEAFLSAVGELCQVNNLSRSAEDVSERYYDTESRLETQKTKLARLQDLLRQAEDMEDIITLESAISETELAIEQLTGTLRKYDSLVNYATVTISLTEVYKLTEVEQPVIGFGAKLGQAFRSGSAGFVDGLQRFLLGVARGWIGWLIFLIIVIAVVLIVLRIRRRQKARSARQPAYVPPQTPQQAPPQPPQEPQSPKQ